MKRILAKLSNFALCLNLSAAIVEAHNGRRDQLEKILDGLDAHQFLALEEAVEVLDIAIRVRIDEAQNPGLSLVQDDPDVPL